MEIPVNAQTKPVEYLTRKFAINYNLPVLGRLVDPARRFPTLTTDSALALGALALLKLRVAIDGKAQAAGAEWDAEMAQANTFADSALAAISASHAGVGYFPTPARVEAALTRYALRKGNANGKWSAPGSYDFDAFSRADTAPVAALLATSVAYTAAIDINLLAGVTDAEGDTVKVAQVGGKNWKLGNTVTIGGVVLTMSANYHLTKVAPAAAAPLASTPFVIRLDDGLATTDRQATLTLT